MITFAFSSLIKVNFQQYNNYDGLNITYRNLSNRRALSL